MNKQRLNFSRALLIVNSLLIFVFLLFLIDEFNLLLIKHLSVLLRFNYVLIFLIILPLKVYCLSGISGGVLEIISEEDTVLLARAFFRNAKELWQGFLSAFVMVLFVDLALFSVFPAFRIWRPLYFSLAAIVAALALSQWTISKKYVKPFGIPQRKVNFDLKFLIVIASAFFLELFLVRGISFVHMRGFNSNSLLAFVLNYLHVFEFIYCSVYILDTYPEIKEKFTCQKEVFLINPMSAGIAQSLGFWALRLNPPFFVVLKAFSPKTYKFREFNRVIWHDRYYKSNVLVCITCFTSNCYEAYKIAKEFKKRGSTVIMGGPHVTYLPEEALAFCDSVVIGGAEGVWKDLIRDYEDGKLKKQYKGVAAEADFAQVHEELLHSPPYVVKDFLETMRGCKFRCHFCTIPDLSSKQVHLQPINTFLELIKIIKPKYSKVTFIDNNIYSDPAYCRELFIALKPLNIKWSSQCSIDIAKNKETLKLARESGCEELLIGYEVFGGSLEKNQGGKFAMAQKFLEYTKIIKKAGIRIKGHFIFGFDSDNLKTLFQLWRFCFSVMPQFTIVSVLTPLPGSGVYRDMLAQDRIINLNWRSYALNRFVIRHPQMNPAVVSFFFPFIQYIFLATTSFIGLVTLVNIFFFPHYGLFYSMIR